MNAPPLLLAPLRIYAGRRVLVAVSGGADSVALTRALHEVGAEPSVAHLDHALRPDSAGDAAFVADLAARLGLPFVTERLDVAAVADKRGWNLEDAARRLRYSFLTRAARRAKLQTILTAHTRSDQAETVLWQLLRGEATLPGIPPRRGHVERPWLEVGRAEVLAYLRALGQPWREDASNADLRFTRNWLRREVLPLLGERHPGLEAALARLARFQAQDDAALTAQARALTGHAPLGRVPLAVLRRRARLELAGREVHSTHLEQVAAALQDARTLHLTLPGAVPLTVTAGRVVPERPPAFPRPDFEVPASWTLRHRQDGDRIRRPGGARKLSDLLSDLKVPRGWRDGVWLLADDRETVGGGAGSTGAAVKWVGLPEGGGENVVWAEGAASEAGQVAAPDAEWLAMGEALRLAGQAELAGEVPIGAVVLHGGRVIAGAANRCREQGDMTRHAELEALRLAAGVVGPYLTDCTLVVTLEPCPMCLGAAIEARVGRVVYAAPNSKAGALGGVADLLEHHWGHRPDIRGGVRASEASRLLRRMFASARARSPAAEPASTE